VGSALLSALEDIATNDRRSVINTWSIHAPASGEGAVRDGHAAAHGPGALRRDDPAAGFFLRRGYVLDQTHSTYQLDLADGWDPEDRSDEAALSSYELVGWEGGTPEDYVISIHRGHGLGRAIKIANLRRARQAHPLLRRVVTTNAGENAAMRSVNLGLGFREVGVDGNWQKVIGGR
jgi:GNAT superfamily N-acetyltransferase